MSNNCSSASPVLADLIPPIETIYERLDRLKLETVLTQRLLSVALRREREVERLSQEGGELCSA